MIRISKNTAYDKLCSLIPPVAYAKSGDTVVFETRDCYDDNIISAQRPLGERCGALENPVTGPLFIEGAESGDILRVDILDITLRNSGVMRSSTESGPMAKHFDERTAQIFEFSDGKIIFDKKLSIPIDTMIGVIGTAPQGEGILTSTPGPHGGNMDCKKIVAGSTLYLPVYHKGALLSLGDLHAAMGDGEVLICGMETAGEVTLRATVIKNASLPTPFLSCREKVMTIQSAETIDEAARLCVDKMTDFLSEATGSDTLHSGMLLSLLGDLAICQMVDPLMTVRMEFPVYALNCYGYQLP